MSRARFAAFAARKAREATAASLAPLLTETDRSSRRKRHEIGSEWTRRLYDGPFHLFPLPPDRPAVSLVFVQSRDGNTGADEPGDLGGGPVDKHLIYEGLSRVAADAVLAGARTGGGPDVFFSVWHPELVALRASLGLPRHPMQILVSGSGRIDIDRALACNNPDVQAIVITSPPGREHLEAAVARRPWLRLLVSEAGDRTGPLRSLRSHHGVTRISAVGGRHTATTLIDAGVVQDLCMTTTARAAGEPDTPFYAGTRAPALDLITRKRGTDREHPMVFEHLAF